MNVNDSYTAAIALNNMIEMSFNYSLSTSLDVELDRFRNLEFVKYKELQPYIMAMGNALSAFQSGRNQDCIHALDEAEMNIGWDESLIRYEIIVSKDKGIVYKREGNYSKASEMFGKALATARDNGINDVEVEMLRHLSDLYHEAGELTVSRKLKLRYYEKKDSLMLTSKLGNVGVFGFKSDLKRANAHLSDVMFKKKIQTVILAVSGIFLMAAFFVIDIIRRQNRELKSRNQTLYANSLDALKREEEERKLRTFYENKISEYEATASKEISETLGKPQCPPDKYIGSSLKDSEKDRLESEIMKVMADPDIFCRDGFSLEVLASLVSSSYKDVSQVINERFSESFKNYLTAARIREACRRFNDPSSLSRLTIEGIAQSVGFKSRSAFSVAFKKIIGISPSDYIKEAKRSIG